MNACDDIPQEVQELLGAWNLKPDGSLATTPSSWLLPVRREGLAILKVARISNERCGYGLMKWWDGDGAACVLASSPNALLIERATGERSLATMAWSGEDDQACEILCKTARRLHVERDRTLPELHPLEAWFQPLFELSQHHSCLAVAATTARHLLSEQNSICPLHGDLHHENVLDFGARGWLAIDPHGLLGERSFDYANIFTNPDLSDPKRPLATLPGRLEARLKIVGQLADIEPSRMLRWVVAWTGLSAAWFIGDNDETGAAIDLAINQTACGLLGI